MDKILPFLFIVLMLFSGTGCATNLTYRTASVRERPSGIYAGAMSFAGEAKDMTEGKPVFLNEEGGLYLARAIFSRYQPGASSDVYLYSAVEQAIASIKSKAEYFPDYLETVNLVVFTDRLPAPQANAPVPDMKAAGKNVNVYAVGILGRDARDSGQFISQLNSLTGDPSRVYQARNYSDIPNVFKNIASAIAGASGKSFFVYMVLDAAPPLRKDDISQIQYSAISVLLDTLSEKADITAPTPVTKTLIDTALGTEKEYYWASPEVSLSPYDPAKFESWGLSMGTSLAPPLLIGTVRFTFAPIGNFFFEPGADIGLFGGEDIDYISLYPYANLNYFKPFEKRGGWYVGAGVGLMWANYNFLEPTYEDLGTYETTNFAFNFVAGINLGDILDISYTLRTNFKGGSNKFSVGFTRRFE